MARVDRGGSAYVGADSQLRSLAEYQLPETHCPAPHAISGGTRIGASRRAESLDAGGSIQLAPARNICGGCNNFRVATRQPPAGAGSWRQHCIASRPGKCASSGDHVGIMAMPLTVSLFYLILVAAMAYELSYDLIRSAQVTRQLQASEATLRESEQRFRTVADAAPVLIWMSGVDKLCTFFNKRWFEFTGRSPEQEMGNGWRMGYTRKIWTGVSIPTRKHSTPANRLLCNID